MMLEWRKLSWWFWVWTVIFLLAGLLGWQAGFILALLTTALQIVYYWMVDGQISSFSVQVRIGYFVLLLIALWEPLNFIYWIPFLGTTASVLFGYCTLARFLSLMPWNRREPISWNLIFKTFVSRPVRGNIMQELRGEVDGHSGPA